MGSHTPTSQPLRLAVLECGDPPPGTLKTLGGYGEMFKTMFTRAADPAPLSSVLDISVYDIVGNPSTYPALETVDAILMTGSKHDAFEDTPWILTLVDYVRRAIETSGVRVIGVCFGHQIVGRALGARVGRNEKGWEVSVMEMKLTEKGREIFGGETLKIHQMHRDIVHELPAGAEVLAETDVCPIQGFVIPGRVITVQGHPEFTEPIVAEILETRRAAGIHTEELYRSGMERVAGKHDGVRIAQAFLKFLRQE